MIASLAIATNTLQNIFFTCSFFPNASIATPVSAPVPFRIIFG